MTQINYSFTRISGNAKTGPIPVTMTSRNSCPSNCALKANGCYAEQGMVRMHWQRLETQGKTLAELTEAIAALPKRQLWRHNVAGDLPSLKAGSINIIDLNAIIKANKGKRGFTYTHNRVLGKDKISLNNQGLIKYANAQGFTINLSANTLAEADAMHALNIGPVVCLIPEEYSKPDAPTSFNTPAGNTIAVCPAVRRDDVTCASCGICQNSTRKAIIGFPAHGTSKRKAIKIYHQESINA